GSIHHLRTQLSSAERYSNSIMPDLPQVKIMAYLICESFVDIDVTF
ncbi:hypothetical protein AAJ76_580002, partial [Vairimorpha ceranae]